MCVRELATWHSAKRRAHWFASVLHWVAMVVVRLLQVELVVCSLVYCRAVRRARAEGSNCKKTRKREREENIQVKLRHEILEELRPVEGRRTASGISSAL